MTQKIINALAATLLTLLVGCATYDTGLETGWSRWEKSEGGNGHYYKAIAISKGISWMQADKLARKQGGYLVTITSEEENAFVFDLVDAPEFINPVNGCGPLIGGFQQVGAVEPDGGWSWVSGEQWNYSNWYSKEPNNFIVRGQFPEDRIVFYGGGGRAPSKTWGDIGRYDINTAGYVIERNQ